MFIEAEEEAGSEAVGAPVHQEESQRSTLDTLKHLLQPCSNFHQQLVQHVRMLQDMALSEGGEVDSKALSAHLAAAGYRVGLRRALGGGSDHRALSNLRHCFLMVEDPPTRATFVVEPHFREQLAISQATPHYSALLAALPSVLVCTPAQLVPVVQLLSCEMAQAFEHHGMSLPPWRNAMGLLSKWLPSKSSQYKVLPDGSLKYEVAPNPQRLSSSQPRVSLTWSQPASPAGGQRASSGQNPALANNQPEPPEESPRSVLCHASSRPESSMTPQQQQQQQQQAGCSTAAADLPIPALPPLPALPSLPQHQQLEQPAEAGMPPTPCGGPASTSLLTRTVGMPGMQRHCTPLSRCLDRPNRGQQPKLPLAVLRKWAQPAVWVSLPPNPATAS